MHAPKFPLFLVLAEDFSWIEKADGPKELLIVVDEFLDDFPQRTLTGWDAESRGLKPVVLRRKMFPKALTPELSESPKQMPDLCAAIRSYGLTNGVDLKVDAEETPTQFYERVESAISAAGR